MGVSAINIETQLTPIIWSSIKRLISLLFIRPVSEILMQRKKKKEGEEKDKLNIRKPFVSG